MQKEWVLVPWIVQKFQEGKSRAYAKICPFDQMADKIENGVIQIKPGYLVDDCLIVELPDRTYEIQLTSQEFSGINRGPYRTLEELQQEVERYTGGVCTRRFGLAGLM